MKINLPLYFIIISLFIGLFFYNYDNCKGFNCGNSFTEFREMPENFEWPYKIRDLIVLDVGNQIAKLNEKTSKSAAMDIYRLYKVISDAKNTKGSWYKTY